MAENILISLLKAAASPFRQASGIGQELVRKAAKLSPEEYKQRQLQAGNYGKLSQAMSLTDKEAQDPLIAAKSIAGIGSYAIPFGKGANLLSKVLLPGAGVGALQGLSQDEVTPKSVALSTVGGAAGAGLLHGASAVGSKVGSSLVSGGKRLVEKAGASFLKSSPAIFQKAAEGGLNINKVFNKYFNVSDNIDTLIGSIEKPGGKLQNSLREQENVINNTIKNSGNDIIATANDLIRPLSDQLTKLASVPGNKTKVDSLINFMDEVKQLYPGGLTAQKLLEVKRLFDKQFGASVVDDATGAVIRDAQKSIANTARAKLKSTFTNIKNALDNESELLTLEPVLQRSRAGAETTLLKQPGGMGLIDTMLGLGGVVSGNPLAGAALIAGKRAIQSPTALKAIGKGLQTLGGNITVPSGNVMSQGASRIGSEVSKLFTTPKQDTPTPNQNQQNETNSVQVVPSTNSVAQTSIDRSSLSPEKQKAMDIIDQAEAQYKSKGQTNQPTNITGYSVDQLGKAYSLALQAGRTKEATQLKQMYDLETEFAKAQATAEKPRKYSEGDKKFMLAGNEAKKALQTLESEKVKTGKIAAVKSKVGEFRGTQDDATTAFKAQLSTARTAARNALLGANMSDKELESYLDAIFDYSNEPSIIKAKLKTFVQSMKDYENSVAGTSDIDNTLQQLRDQGLPL